MSSYLFTSESTTEGQPDKVCDQISDAILDAILSQDKYARVDCNTLFAAGLVIVVGQVTARCDVNVTQVARETLRDIGYTDASTGFDCNRCTFLTTITQQSPNIASGVDELGAGNQGMMFGYATNETPELLPLPITIAHRLTRRLDTVRKGAKLPYLLPDGKSQVTVRYQDGEPLLIDNIVVSAQHRPGVSPQTLRDEIINKVIKPVVPRELIDEKSIRYIINSPTGIWTMGGPQSDCGLTGTQIMIDTYGGVSRHGGGAFSGRDPTKTNRSAAYYARYVAKNVVAAGLADKCEVQVSYALGLAEPTSIMVDTFGTGRLPEAELTKIVEKVFNFTPSAIIETLNLRRPIYRRTAVYGHFGREDEGFTWEVRDKAQDLQLEASRL